MAHEDDWSQVLRAASTSERSLSQNERRESLNLALRLGPTISEQILGCSITQATDSGYSTPAASTSVALELDLAQYVNADGPCVSACRDGRSYDIVLMADEASFPHFTSEAARLGVRSSLSLPLPNRRAAALNLYAGEADAFSNDHAKATASLLARCVGQFLPESVDEHVGSQDDLDRALRSREIVARAQTVLAEREDIELRAAFELIIELSRRHGKSTLGVATEILDGGAA